MPRNKRRLFSHDSLARAYQQAGSIEGVAKALDISYPTAAAWLTDADITKKPPGYNKPDLPLTGQQCRHAREYLKLTRDDLVARVGISKTSLQTFELNKKLMRRHNVQRLMQFYQNHGIEFNDDGTFKAS